MHDISRIDGVKGTILSVIAKNPFCTVEFVYETCIKSQKKTLSKNSIYRVIAQMVEQGILVRDRSLLSVNIAWIHRIIDQSKETVRRYMTTFRQDYTLPRRDGEREIYETASVKHLHTLWMSFFYSITHQYPVHTLYHYSSHAWFLLASHRSERDFYKSLHPHGLQCFYTVGNITVANRLAGEDIQGTGIRYAVNTIETLPHTGYGMVILEPFVIEYYLPRKVSAAFDDVIEEVSDRESLEQKKDAFTSLLNKKENGKIIIEYSQEKAAKWIALLGDSESN